MKYSSIVVGPLRAYLQPGIPLGPWGVQIYPAASQNIPVAKDIGVVANFSDSLVFEAKTNDGTQTAKGKWTRYAVGVRAASWRATSRTVRSSASKRRTAHRRSSFPTTATPSFRICPASTTSTSARAPMRASRSVRPRCFVGAGYMNILSSGKFGEMFPHATLGGVDAKLGASYGLMPWLDVKAAFAYTRISKQIAAGGQVTFEGGALDQYFVGNVGLSGFSRRSPNMKKTLSYFRSAPCSSLSPAARER